MSLKGLEDAKVIEAHDSAIAEPGGWFLLKYASRDEVDLLGKGTGGIVEIRNAIAQYEESSPLFGFLRYRRRSVLIKYVPEDCSRLIQARVSVHFTAFSERFAPHDTIFPITSSKELRDTTLSAACSLHTASGSTSSSTSSLRRRRLMEIAEEAEEDQRGKRQSTVPEERPPTAKESTKQLDSDGNIPLTNIRSLDVDTLSTLPTSDNRPLSPTATRRLSSQSVRPHMYTLSSYGTSNKPKIKLGPRPSLDHKASSDSGYRPVASLPAGLRIFRRGSKKQKLRPQSSEQSASTSLPTSHHTSGLSEMRDAIRPHTSGGRPVTSSGVSIRNGQSGSSLLSHSNSTSRASSNTMTPEKARLMKALQLRKKQMSSTSPEPEVTQESSPDDHAHHEAPEIGTNRSSNAADIDSGGINSAYNSNDFCSELTKTDSSPTSPICTEHGASTKASSISESTEETVQESVYQKEQFPVDEATLEAQVESEAGDNDIHSLSAVDEAAEDEAGQQDALASESQKTALEEIHGDDTLKDEDATIILATNATEASERLPSEDTPVPDETEETDSRNVPDSDVTGEKEAEVSSSVNEVPKMPEIESPKPVAPPSHSDFPTDEQTLVNPIAEPEMELAITPVEAPISENEPLEDVSESTIPSLTPSRDLQIPRSKFSTSDLRNSDEQSVADQKDLSTDQPAQIPSGQNGNSLLEIQEAGQKHKRRTSRIDRRGIDVSAGNSDNEFLEDDDLMDELQSATVQEAKPMSVAKSPMSLSFPTSPIQRPNNEANRVSRVFSNPLMNADGRSKGLSPPDRVQTSRSVSAGDAFLNRINQQQAATVAKKVNVGTGISQRIKALEKLTSSSPNPGTLSSTGTASPAFFSVRQASIRRAKSPTISDRANSITQNTPSLSRSPSFSPEGTPELGAGGFRDRASSIQSRKEIFNTGQSSRPATARPESISVTARIIRDPNQPFPQLSEAGKDPLDYAPLDLKSSPLTINHQKAGSTTKQSTVQERRSSKEIKNDRRSSITIVKDLLTSPRRSSFSSIGRRSITLERPEPSPRPETSASTTSLSSRRSSRGNGLSQSPSITTTSPTSPKPPLSAGHPKSEGRGMKMLRRMSSGFSNSRKSLGNVISPTVREETEPSAATVASSQSSIISTDIGDVNVQFPDTLLWKRRHLLLDSQGFLVLSASLSQSGSSAAMAGIKRYHMNDLRMPVIPDVDMQELPNSVSLEFVNGGGGLQFACEDRAAQSHVLHLLEDAHRAWSN